MFEVSSINLLWNSAEWSNPKANRNLGNGPTMSEETSNTLSNGRTVSVCCRQCLLVGCAVLLLVTYLIILCANDFEPDFQSHLVRKMNIFPTLRTNSFTNSLSNDTGKKWTASDEVAANQGKANESIILFWTFNYFSAPMGLNEKNMVDYDCGNYQCGVTRNRKYINQSHVIIFNPRASQGNDLPQTKQPWQRWVIQTGESPIYEGFQAFFDGKANWTFTYHNKSEISWVFGFSFPRGKYDKGPFILPNGDIRKKCEAKLEDTVAGRRIDEKTVLSKKEKGVLWIVSNCGARRRNNYVKELGKCGLAVEKFGNCGRRDPCKRNKACVRNMFLRYQFYIAFENSRCDDYITEKVWRSLVGGMVPIVMGPSIESYQQRLPPNSFLHVDNFTGPAQLAQYVKKLLNDKEAYRRYHAWRKNYDVLMDADQVFHTLWVCDVCKKIHNPPKPAYNDISQWWKPNVQCNYK